MKNEPIRCKSCGAIFTDIKIDDYNQCPYCNGISYIGKEDVENKDPGKYWTDEEDKKWYDSLFDNNLFDD